MPNSVLVIVFSQGLGLLAILAIGYGVIARLSWPAAPRTILLGCWFGAGAVLAMAAPAQMAPGLILDVRAIIVGMAAAFGGPLVAAISATFAVAYRAYLGGVGALPGSLAIILGALIGLFGARYLSRVIRPTGPRYAVLGFLISLNFVSIFVLPFPLALSFALTTWPLIAVTSVVAGAFLGAFMERERLAIERERHWQKSAMSDALTGLLNRRGFEKISGRFLADYNGGVNCSLLVVDVDHFKDINDQHGHLAGDQVIMQIGAILKSAVRPTDIVARIGGEEFAILLIDAAPCKTIEIAERVRRNVETAHAQVGGVIVPVRVSVGGVYQLMSASYEENFKVADLALYRAKRAGRNRVVFSEAEPLCEFGDLTLKRA